MLKILLPLLAMIVFSGCYHHGYHSCYNHGYHCSHNDDVVIVQPHQPTRTYNTHTSCCRH